MKNAAKKILSVFLALLMLIPTGIMSVFAQAEDASSADTETDVSYDSTNAVGAMILDATQEGSGEEADYVIQSVDIEGKYARVDFINLDACAIVVAVYDESGKTMLGSGKEEIEAKEAVTNDSVTVTIEIDEMPEYFLVKAFMLDENNAPLCHNYETKEYTQAFEEFLEKTTDDFDDDVVINLDNSENNNFLVVSDDAIVIDAKDGVNTVTTDDYENGLYVIENADSQITSLKPGDMIYYQYGNAEDEYILATVGSIDVDGDTVTITSAETGELTDYFDYVKIDVEATQTTFDGSEMYKDVTHTTEEAVSRTRGDTNIDGSASVSDKWSISKSLNDAVKLSGSISVKLTMSLKIYIDDATIGINYAYVEAVIKYSATFSISLSGKIAVPAIPLGTIGLDTGKLGITAAVKFQFIMEGSATLSLNFKLSEGSIGFAFDSDVGIIDKRKAPTSEFSPEINESISVFVGLSIKLELEATKHVNVSASAKAGIELSGKIPTTSSDEHHPCTLCIDGKASFKLSVGANIKFFNWIDKSITFLDLGITLGKFYFSLDNGFGFGTCPNRAYVVTVVVYDNSTLEPLTDVTIDSKYTPDADGRTKVYLKNGTHTLEIALSTGKVYSKIVTIKDGGKNITLYVSTSSPGTDDMESEEEDIPSGGSGSDVEDTRTVTASGTIGDNLTWMLYEDGEVVIEGYGGMVGTQTFSSPLDSYREIKRATISEGITSIGSAVFFALGNLVSVSIPDTVKSIGYAAFGKTNLTSVIIPDSVTTIGNHAFWDCTSLESVTIGNGVTTIETSAFWDCTNLESVTIGNSVTTIDSSAFLGCNNLTTVYYTGTQEQWDAISIGSYNTNLTNANIICSDTVATAAIMALSFDDEIAAYSPRAAVQSETVNSAVVGNSYVILVVKDSDAEDLLASDNLLYIDQKIAESETLTFDFDLNGETDYDVIVTNTELDHYHNHTAVVTAPTCTEQGYTTYTCYCGDTYVSSYVPVVGHDYVAVVTAPTCTEQGYTTYVCTCGDTYTGDYVDALGHTETIISGVPADCTNNGITDGVICLACQTELTAQESIPAIGHVNSNGDSSCDSCGHDLSEECSHICHGNAFLKFFWQIALFFSKLFNIQSNRYCDCGIAHW